MRAAGALLAVVMLCGTPVALSAQPRGGGGRGGGGGGAPARPAAAGPTARAAPAMPAPAMRAPVMRQAPVARAAPVGGGFDLGNEVRRPEPAAPVARAIAPVARAAAPLERPGAGVVPRTQVGQRPAGGYPSRPPRPTQGYAPVRPARTLVANPSYRGAAWGWNGGTVWSPASGYWGGGFWGALALAATSAVFYGSLVDAQGQTLASYEVTPDSPGAQLLTNYQLTQTDCSQTDLVVIYGPNTSLICAYPNAIVGPGNYSVDPSGLTITSE